MAMKFLFFLQECLAASILIHSSMGGRSHIKAMLELGQTLGERGHQVKYVALDDNLRFAKGYGNITQVGLGEKGFYTSTLMDAFDAHLGGKVGEDYDLAFGNLFVWWLSESFRVEYKPFLEYVKREQPDLIICDLFANACQEVAEAYAIPLVMGLQSLDWLNLFNSPYITSETRVGTLTIENMSFVDKLMDTFLTPLKVYRYWTKIYAGIQKERVSLGSKATWNPKGAFRYGLALVNSFVPFEPAQPLPPNVKLIGPILSPKASPLDNSLEEFLGKHKKVMLVAFGSLLSLQIPEITCILSGALEAMEEGHIDGLIWGLGRTSLDNFPNKTTTNHDFTKDTRFQILSWAPQQGILDHPSTVVFLSHGGIESTFEAMHSKKAIINLPFLGDQPRNAAKINAMGIGVYLNPHNIDVAEAIKHLLARPDLAYRQTKAQAIVGSHLRRRQEAVNLIEDHLELAQACRPLKPYLPGGTEPPCELDHLLPASTRMSYIQANRIDIYAAVLFGAFAFIANLRSLARLLFPPRNALMKPTKQE